MDSNLQLGPFVLKTQWLVIMLSMSVAYFVIWYRLKKIASIEASVKDQITETIEKGAVIAILTWKFSFLAFHPIRVVTNPISILYYSGGESGIGLAFVVFLLYFYYHSKRDHIPLGVYGDLLAASFLAGIVVYSLFALLWSQQGIWVYGSEILLAMLLYLLYFRESKGTVRLGDLNQSLMWFSLGQVFISFLNPLKQYFLWGFSKLQITFLFLAAFCIMIDFFRAKNRAG